jgi:DNA-binding transcriptional regulator YdaS (Cro superfamily)
MTPKEALQKAIDLLKTQSALAAVIGGTVKTGHIYYWLNSGQVPAEHCPSIERATEGKVRCEDLCPGADWAYLREQTGA